MKGQRRGVVLAVVSMCLVLAAACGGGDGGSDETTSGGSWDSVVAAAKKEGKVVFYTSLQPAQVDALKKAFETEYPEISVDELRGAGLVEKVEQERASGAAGADVINTTEKAWFKERSAAGDFSPLTGPALKSWEGTDYLDKDFYVQYIHSWGIGYNTDLVKTPITSPEDLLKPEFKGKLAAFSVEGTTPLGSYNWLKKTYGVEFLKKLAAQNPKLYPSSTPMAEAVGSGEVAAAVLSGRSAYIDIKKNGAPVDFVMPSPATYGAETYTAAAGWSPHPNAGRVFADFLMGAGQKILASDGNYFAPTADTEPGAIDLKGIKLELLDDSFLDQSAVDKFRSEWTSIFR